MTENKSIQEIQPEQANKSAKKGIPMPIKVGGMVVGLGIAALFNTACPQEPPTEEQELQKEYNFTFEEISITVDNTSMLATNEDVEIIKDIFINEMPKYDVIIPIIDKFKARSNNMKIIISSVDYTQENKYNEFEVGINYLRSKDKDSLTDSFAVAINNMNTFPVSKLKANNLFLANTKPVITPRRLAAFEKANKATDMIVNGGAAAPGAEFA
jgi:hypothetical protein